MVLYNFFSRNKFKDQLGNVSARAILKTYSFLSGKNSSKFNNLVLKKLKTPHVIRSTISLSRLVYLAQKNPLKTIVIIGKILNDDRVVNIPSIHACALKATFSVKKRISEAGGSIVTFNELAFQNPTGKNTFLVKNIKSRKHNRHAKSQKKQ